MKWLRSYIHINNYNKLNVQIKLEQKIFIGLNDKITNIIKMAKQSILRPIDELILNDNSQTLTNYITTYDSNFRKYYSENKIKSPAIGKRFFFII